MTINELEKEIEYYLNHIIWAHDCYNAYFSIFKSTKDYLDELRLSNFFFTVAKQSLVTSLMLEISKLYGKNEQKSLWKLLSNCRESISVLPRKKCVVLWQDGKTVDSVKQLLDIAEKTLHEMENPIAQLKGRRDKYYAHNDKEFFMPNAPLTEKYPISYDEIEKLLSFAAGFCNSLLDLITDRMICPISIGSDDLRKMLALVHTVKSIRGYY